MIERISVFQSAEPAKNGQLCVYKNWAAYEWHDIDPAKGGNPLDLPTRPDRLIAQYSHGYYLLNFLDDSFQSSGGKWGKPLRWAYLRLQEEIWTGTQWALPDGSTPPHGGTRPAIDPLVFQLMTHYPVKDIQDAMDRHVAVYGTGAPE